MPRHGKTMEKSKDFKGSMKRLFNSLNNFKYLLIFALTLGLISAVIALITPNKLSELTDTITLGIQLDVSEKKIKEIMNDESISLEDKSKLQSLMSL